MDRSTEPNDFIFFPPKYCFFIQINVTNFFLILFKLNVKINIEYLNIISNK
jgi:hypothetical protein